MRYLFPNLAIALTIVAASACAACEPTLVSTLPLISSDRPVIRATIDGAAVIMLIDTGAQTTIVTPETASRLKLKRDSNRGSHLVTLGGARAVPNVIIDRLAFSGASFTTLSVPAMTLRGAAAGQDGIIGGDLLHQFDLDIDIAHQKLTLYRPESCTPVHPPWDAHYQTWPVTISPRQQITFPAKLDGHAVTALLDTGAFRGTLSRAAAERAGVTPAELQRDFARRTSAPLIYRFSRHHFDSLAFGNQIFRDTWLDVVDFNQEGVDMLIGVDYLLRRRVFISYASGIIFMQPEPDSN